MTATDDRERLEARLERERRARRQAEQIAERGMRELWEANRELQLRIDARTGRLERELAALSLVHRSAMAEIEATLEGVVERLDSEPAVDRDVVARLRRLAASVVVTPSRSSAAPVTASVLGIADELLDRWQRVAARAGQLLSVEADDTDALTARWDHVLAAVDTVLAVVTRHGHAGSVSVVLGAASDGALDVELRHMDASDRAATAIVPDSPLAEAGAAHDVLGIARELAEAVDGRLEVVTDADGLVVTLRFPTA